MPRSRHPMKYLQVKEIPGEFSQWVYTDGKGFWGWYIVNRAPGTERFNITVIMHALSKKTMEMGYYNLVKAGQAARHLVIKECGKYYENLNSEDTT